MSKEIEVQIKNNAGLHARPSALFVQTVTQFSSEIKIISNGEEINGKSIMGLMLLAAEKGRILKVVADGEDEDAVLAKIKQLVEVDKFGEE
jgi:phosphocarrier protein HPr